MAEIRKCRTDDLSALYAICLATGDAGSDGAHLYRDPDLLGHVYAGPYGVLAPDSTFVLKDAEGIGGYIAGACDTVEFEERLDRDWWPALQARYPEGLPEGTGDTPLEARMRHRIHHPLRTPGRIVDAFPSHFHINLVARLRGQDWGRRLIAHWLAAVAAKGSPGAHLMVGTGNAGAVAFYRACGFAEIARPRPGVIVFGVKL